MDNDLENLASLWLEYDHKLNAVLTTNRRLLEQLQRKPVRSSMRRLTWMLAFEAVVCAVGVALLGSFLADHITVAVYAVSAGTLVIGQIALLAAVIGQIVLTRQIDYAAPVTNMQHAVERLRLVRVRTTQALLAGVALAWPPLLIVLFQWLFGINAYQAFGAAYVWSCVAFGAAAIPLAVWIARHVELHADSSPALRYVMRTINGSSINEANASLAALAAFEQ